MSPVFLFWVAASATLGLPDATAQEAPRPMASHEHMHADMSGMPGMYGPYPASREATGTSWQPESTQMKGTHLMAGPWMIMLHGAASAG